MLDKTLNIRGTLTSLATPLVMGILNITPDSFYAGSRKQTETAIEDRIREILSEGGDWIDIGGYSSRPDAAEVTPEEEMRRLEFALHILNKHYPDIPVSVDTFRAGIARRCVEEYGAAIINDTLCATVPRLPSLTVPCPSLGSGMYCPPVCYG